MKIKLIFILGVITQLAGCSNVLNPPEAPADKAGTVTFTVGQGLEARTVFPSLSQFSKVALTFAGSPAVEEAIVSGGSVTLSLPIGSWNVTADAYIGDVLAAQSAAHSIAWSGTGDIAGVTRFVLGPIGSGNGTLKGVVTPPAGITLGAFSRIAIEGQPEIPVTGAMEGEVSLPEGRYYVDVVLENAKTGATAVYRRIVAILSGLTTEIRFAPSAAEFLSGEARAALSSVEGLVFGPTATNAAGIVVDDEDWVNGNIRIAAPGGTAELHFTVYNPNALTLTAANATWVSSAEGSASSANLSVFKVDTSALNGNNGAELAVTITAAEQSREGIPITVTVTLAPTFTDLGELTAYFAGLAQNTAAMSYAVKLEGFNLGNNDLAAKGHPLGRVYAAAGTKYFSLDLSDCTGNLGNAATSVVGTKTRLVNCVLPDDLTGIGNYVFDGCDNLASVTLPAGLSAIGDYAFRYCRSLDSAALPAGLATIGNYAFAECHSLGSVTVPGSVISIGNYGFSNCYSLSSLTLNQGLVTIGVHAFTGCDLDSVDFPQGLVSIGLQAFADCPLTAITFVENGGLTSIGGGAFQGCPLVSVVLPEGLTTFGGADGGSYVFRGCASLESVILPSTLTSVGNVSFAHCPSLRDVTIRDGVQVLEPTLFSDCPSLESIVLPESITTIGDYVFANTSLVSINLPAGVTAIGDQAFANCASLVSVTFASGSVLTNIGRQAFRNCYSLASINLPEGLTTIGDNAFANCGDLASVTVPASVTGLGMGAFSGVTGTIAIAPANANYGILEGNILVVLSAPTTLKDYYGNGDVDLSDVTGLTAIGASAFYDNTAITGITLHQNVTTIGANAFQNCTALTTVTAPGVQTSGDNAFDGCTALTTVSLPELTISGNYAFYGCTALTTLTLPKLATVGTSAFRICTALTTITLPTTLTSIALNAFTNCSNLVSVTIQATTPPTVVASSFNNTAAGLKIYVPAASLETYKAASVWSSTTYVNKLAAIPSI